MEKAFKIEWPQTFALRITLWIQTRRSPPRSEAVPPRMKELPSERIRAEAYRILQLPK